MDMKRVSFKVAKAIKEAGYPQHNQLITDIGWYNMAGVYTNQLPTQWEGDNMFVAVAPTYIEVWLWLWREKKICINCKLDKYNLLPMWWCTNEDGINYNTPNFNDPEEAIISAIEYIVENDLIKQI